MDSRSFGTERRDVDLLLVEPDPDHARVVEESFADSSNLTLYTVSDGERALDFIDRCDEYVDAPCPDLVILDPKLPHPGGFEILETLKAEPELRLTPVIVLASSTTTEDVEKSYELHANAYVHKADSREELAEIVDAVKAFWLSTVRLPPKQRR